MMKNLGTTIGTEVVDTRATEEIAQAMVGRRFTIVDRHMNGRLIEENSWEIVDANVLDVDGSVRLTFTGPFNGALFQYLDAAQCRELLAIGRTADRQVKWGGVLGKDAIEHYELS